MRAAWADPEKRARMAEAIRKFSRTAEFRDAARARVQRAWGDPATRAKMVAKIAAANKKDDVREARRRQMLAKWRQPSMAARLKKPLHDKVSAAERMRKLWADPVEAARMRAACAAGLKRPEVRAHLSAAMKLRKNPAPTVSLTLPLREALIGLRTRGFSVLRCAVEIGVCDEVCTRWLHEIGMPPRSSLTTRG